MEQGISLVLKRTLRKPFRQQWTLKWGTREKKLSFWGSKWTWISLPPPPPSPRERRTYHQWTLLSIPNNMTNFFGIFDTEQGQTCVSRCSMPNLIKGRRFIAIRRKAMKIWDSKLTIFTRKIWQVWFLYLYEYATVFYETARIYWIRNNKLSGEAYI